jgi:hypothetical protein
MKVEGLQIEEIEVSHTLGGYRQCRCYSVVRYTIVNRSRRICCWNGKGLVAEKTHGPVRLRERESWSWGGCWCEYYSVVRRSFAEVFYIKCPFWYCHRVTITFFLALLSCCTRTKFQQPMVHGRQFCASLKVINKLKIEDTVRNSLRVSDILEWDQVVSRWDRMSSINSINQFFTTNTLKRERGKVF